MKINFILLALMSLFLTALGNSNGNGPYVDYCKFCADDYGDCLSRCAESDRNCVRDCLLKICVKSELTYDHRKPTVSCNRDCKMSCPK